MGVEYGCKKDLKKFEKGGGRMAKFFRIKNKGLRWIAGSVVLLCVLAMVGFLLYYFCFGLGYGLNAFNSNWFSGLNYYRGDPTVGVFAGGGALLLCLIVLSCVVIYVFVLGAKGIGNKLFNSIGNSKKRGDS